MEPRIRPRFRQPVQARDSGHSAIPLSAYEKLKPESAPDDPFKGFLSGESLSGKLAMLCLFSSAVSAWTMDYRPFTLVAFSGFLLFGVLYGFFRLRSLRD